MIKPKCPGAKIVRLPERTKKSWEESLDKLVYDLKKEWQKLFGYFTKVSKQEKQLSGLQENTSKQKELDELLIKIQDVLSRMNTISFGAEQVLREYNTKHQLKETYKNVAEALTEIKNFNEFLSEKTK